MSRIDVISKELHKQSRNVVPEVKASNFQVEFGVEAA
jgi:hypothetical protein